MASTPVLSFRPAGVQACAAAGDRRSARKVASAGGGNWWTPLFGWPAEPDYIEGADGGGAGEGKAAAADGDAAARIGKARSVAFTDDKARRLRMMTAETSNFHDVMYHSSIAARLASDFSTRSGQ
ncbi:hypothetical protein Taro_008400 [Colocasia esculenta]|uniref:Uncharacterized protein n=1 Tax=Colocasia esculenta TaxID=4460 RepID=A0A843TX29_COLES|nr:hypothetical protein [Colocasia esculenta]